MSSNPLLLTSIPVDLKTCSVCKNICKSKMSFSLNIDDVLIGIRLGYWKDEVDEFKIGKRRESELPLVNAYGAYEDDRFYEELRSRSGLLVLSCNQIDNPGIDFAELKLRLTKLSFVYAVFKSPSGTGLKALIRIPDDSPSLCAFECAGQILALWGVKVDVRFEARRFFSVSCDKDIFVSDKVLACIPPIPKSLDKLCLEDYDQIFLGCAKRFLFKGKKLISTAKDVLLEPFCPRIDPWNPLS